MRKDEYEKWVSYRLENMSEELTLKDKKEFRACDFALHMLLPTNKFLEAIYWYYQNPTHSVKFIKKVEMKVKGQSILFDALNQLLITNDRDCIEWLAKQFLVERELIDIKLGYLKQTYQENSEKTKQLKKEK